MRASLSQMTRRTTLGVAFAGAMALAACGGSGGGDSAEGDMALGAPAGAKVTVVEYASVTCSHCAAWNAEIWPDFKAKYVDTNKVRYIFREFPTPPQDVAQAGFLVARCAGDDKYFHVVDQIMRAQPEIFAGQGRAALQRIAAENGLTSEQFSACVADEKANKAFEARVAAGRAAGISLTPTFLVNGKKTTGSSMEELSAAIDPLLGS